MSAFHPKRTLRRRRSTLQTLRSTMTGEAPETLSATYRRICADGWSSKGERDLFFAALEKRLPVALLRPRIAGPSCKRLQTVRR